MNAVKKRNLFKKVMIFALMLSFVLGQFTPVQAAAKKENVAISLNKQVYTLKKGKSVKLKATLNKAQKRKAWNGKAATRKLRPSLRMEK